jgi:hypothetical protein
MGDFSSAAARNAPYLRGPHRAHDVSTDVSPETA